MRKLRILALLLAAVLLAALPASASGYDGNQKGSVTVILRETGKGPLPDTEILLYPVGAVTSDNSLSFAPLPPFTGISLEDLRREDLPRELLTRAREQGVAAQSQVTDGSGQVRFSELDQGLYLICQGKAHEGYYDIVPFLVSIPMNSEAGWLYDVEARPKVAPEPEATKPTTPGGGGGGKPPLIQTGQLNWPVPVLALTGILLFSLGWSLVFLRDKRR